MHNRNSPKRLLQVRSTLSPQQEYRRTEETRRNELLAAVADYELIVQESNASSASTSVDSSPTRNYHNSAGQHRPIPIKSSRPPPASAGAIGALPRARVLPLHRDHAMNTDPCGICCEDLTDGIVLMKLPCGHIYHLCCIVPWLKTNCTCPECRYELPTDDPVYEVDRRQRMTNYRVISCNCRVVHQCFFDMPKIHQQYRVDHESEYR
jgi:hypothetical protein